MKTAPHYHLLLVLATLLLCCCTTCKPKQTTTEQDNTIDMQGSPVMIDDTTVNGLVIYYPQYSRIDLVCGKMPSKTERDVIFCAEAAFTHELLDEFAHRNIEGDHVSGGKRYMGEEYKDKSGATDWIGERTGELVKGK